VGHFLGTTLKEVVLPLPLVGDVRGRGLLWAVEFVTDKKSKGQFPAHSNFSKKVVAAALENGLYLHGASGRSGPFNVEYVMIAPWYLIMKTEVGLVVDKLRVAIETASQGSQRTKLDVG
jgi:adenosylmethionine-8-amino-7-oxononanoate aminotransferase